MTKPSKQIDVIIGRSLHRIRMDRLERATDDLEWFMQSKGFAWPAGTVEEIEDGFRALTLGEAWALAEGFDLSVSELIEGA